MSPNGRTVFVTGYSWGSGTYQDYATIAYRTSTGQRLWVARYNGPSSFSDFGESVTVSPDGTKVFVTGDSDGGRATWDDYATVAYSAGTGAQLWVKRYNGPASKDDAAISVAVSPGGGRVFVTGYSDGKGTERDYATVAYRASTGKQLWVSRYNGPASGYDEAKSLAVSPSGQMVFVTGQSPRQGAGRDYATVAYRASTGKQLWVSRYNGPGNGADLAWSVAVSPGSSTVLVTGSSFGGKRTHSDYATVAYRALTGKRLWVARYNGPGSGDDSASSLALNPSGTKVFVTGYGVGTSSGEDCTTIAYRTTTGAQLWAKRYNGPGNRGDDAFSIAISPAGDKVFVTGASYTGPATMSDYVTIAYRASTGARLWVAGYSGPANVTDQANAVVASATRVIVTGVSDDSGADPQTSQYATVAYTP